jgi:tetratricopeptide (TPR) repeat protein
MIGSYKLIEQIGEGGMGVVWMAQQTEPVKRLVAVKLIKAGMDSKQVIARFEAERQALALMDHANIARVLDGGTTSAGRPYFVMDLVKGVPITRYCDEHHLTPRQRLELFIPICQAVQHAHQKGIIHRDLKPSNVLVALYDGKPVPKVIDFGVAKATGQALTEKTLGTGFGNIVGTLEYMSPEQAEINQLDIDTRSDIYSLGVLLYELLAGTPPFSRKELENAGVLEMLRVIREQEPAKPSTKLSTADGLPTLAANRGTEPAKLTKLVRGELDWIVMKALEKDRNRRYETANGFAMDVQRYLADEAVLACPPSAGYRFRKFARRNKGGLAVAALVLFFLVLLGSGAGWAVRDRAAREAEAAHQQAARQAKVAGQVESIFAEVDRLEKEQKWPEALAAARRAEAAVAGSEADAGTADRVRQLLKDLEFIDWLEQIRMQEGNGPRDMKKRDQDYARAFRDCGVDVDELAVEASVERLKARSALAIPLAAILDQWVFDRRGGAAEGDVTWKRLVAVARGIDPEPQRDQLRSTWGRPVSQTRDVLRRLADSVDVRAHHPATLYCLASTLLQVELTDSSLRILREAQSFHPRDYWINRLLRSRVDLRGFVGILRTQGKLDEAIIELRQAGSSSSTVMPDYNLFFGQLLNDRAWQLSVGDPRSRDPRRALSLAEEAVAVWPCPPHNKTLGVAQYRAGNWNGTIELLDKLDPYWRNDSVTLFVLSAAHGQANEIEKGRKLYDQAVQWRMGNGVTEEELRRLCAEAAAVLGVEVPPALKEPPVLTPGPTLLKPAAGAALDNGALDGSKTWVREYKWSAVPGATRYHLYITSPTTPGLPFNLPTLTSSTFRSEDNSYVGDHARLGWRWKVRALVNGVWSDWSEERTFDIAPLDYKKLASPKK